MLINFDRFDWPQELDEHMEGFLNEVSHMERYYKNLLNLNSENKNVSFDKYYPQIEANFKIVDSKINELMDEMETFVSKDIDK
jgi:hypothetical protein